MNFKELTDFIESKMRMSHIYQPLFIISLIEAGGTATIRQIAQAFLSKDESQLQYYERIIKSMPLKVLIKRGVVENEGELVSLCTKKLSYEQKALVKMLCEQRLQKFIIDRGLGIFDYRMLNVEQISDSLRYRVLKESGGRCALCGATKEDRPLDVDHIKPRSKGGDNTYNNLQVLCSKCNRSKGNKDDTDFRTDLVDSVSDCKFCFENMKKDTSRKIVDEYDSVYAIDDGYAVTEGHKLIIPKRHTQDYFSMSKKEKNDTERLLEIFRKTLLEKDPLITGFNIGMNCGETAGQTMFHCHTHLIPRRKGDTPNPRGGVRGVIPDRMNY